MWLNSYRTADKRHCGGFFLGGNEELCAVVYHVAVECVYNEGALVIVCYHKVCITIKYHLANRVRIP